MAVAIVRPRIARPPWRIVDAFLLTAIGVVVLQLVPLPPAVRDALSPHAAAVERAIRLGPASGAGRPISLDARETAIALLVDVLALGVFWTAREAVVGERMRTLARTILGAGFVVSIAAIVGTAVAPGSHLVYGVFEPTDPSAHPYGPFLNRNELATWVLLALPLLVGYMVARIRRRAHLGVTERMDATTVWFAGGACIMIAALIVSMSRSGVIGATAEAVCGLALSLAAVERRRRAVVGAIGVLLTTFAVALAVPKTSELIGRFDSTLALARPDGRAAIWRDTRTMIRDFPLTGVGAGAYPTGMLVYQQGGRLFFFNHAHDQYLQILAEGGALVAIPLVIGFFAYGGLLVRRLRSDRSAAYWIRAGAATGIVGALVQSIWDVGLTAPANALLFAAVCAIAVHQQQDGV